MPDFSIVTVDAGNVDELGLFCVGSRKHPGYKAKRTWLDDRFDEGLRFKLAVTGEGKEAGFLEYTPGEQTWRVVEAPGYLVIHCIWVKPKPCPGQGVTDSLLTACLDDAAAQGKHGVAVVTSDGPWMAGREVFLKHGFEQVGEAPPHYQLLVRRTGKGPLPAFPRNWEERLGRSRALKLFYANQCPYIGKAVAELPPVAKQHGTRLRLVEMKDPAEARERMPSPYGVMALVCRGRLLADHAISATRFRNILHKDLRLVPMERD